MSQIQSVDEGQHVGHAVTIIFDDEPRQVRAGSWLVTELKAALGVDPAKVLAEITPQGLKDLKDDGKVAVHEGAKFMSHARSGGSS